LHTLADLADLLQHAAYLLALAIAPPLLSPAPVLATEAASTALAGAAIGAVVIAAGRLRVRLGGRAGDAAAALLGAAVVAALVAADLFRGEHGPIGCGAVYVAAPLWAGFAIVAGALAGRRLPRYRAIAAVAVAALGAPLVVGCARWVTSPERAFFAALERDGDNTTALDALTRAHVRAKRYEAALAVVERCLAQSPGACACHAMRVDLATRAGAAGEALEQARVARERCPASPAVRAASVEAQASVGDAEQAEQDARAALARGEDGRLHYAIAIASERLGRHSDALEEAKRAVRLGAGRDAALLLALLAINAGDLDAASQALSTVIAADPDDADALYDLALVADRRGDYNKARQGYLAALRADPKLAAARYNLVWLTLRAGAVDEARHHAQRFAASFPQDPRGASLAKLVADAEQKAAVK
jgi:tetratricopeptide (TPR) repeat protein